MKKLLPVLAVFLVSHLAHAQGGSVWDGLPGDSVVFDFTPGDSLHHLNSNGHPVSIDTTGCVLWQIGTTTKPGFLSAGAAARGIMTDTLRGYAANRDDYFTIKGFNTNPNWLGANNPILTFEHRYETRQGHAGGCVELSNDSGATWKSIFQLCNDTNTNQNPSYWESVYTDNFYVRQDTLQNGIPAFSGRSNGYIQSRLQLFWGIPIKSLQAPCNFWHEEIWVRFRFLSDSTTDTLAGWAIRRVAVEYDLFPGAVTGTAQAATRLSYSPNPSATGVFLLDKAFEVSPEQRYEVRNALGTVVISGKPERTFDLSHLPKGLYWIRIWGKGGSAVGKVVWE